MVSMSLKSVFSNSSTTESQASIQKPPAMAEGFFGSRSPRCRNERRISPLQAFADHELQEVNNTVAVAPFVVVPADQFEEVAVQFDRRTGIVDRAGGIVNEVS